MPGPYSTKAPTKIGAGGLRPTGVCHFCANSNTESASREDISSGTVIQNASVKRLKHFTGNKVK